MSPIGERAYYSRLDRRSGNRDAGVVSVSGISEYRPSRICANRPQRIRIPSLLRWQSYSDDDSDHKEENMVPLSVLGGTPHLHHHFLASSSFSESPLKSSLLVPSQHLSCCFPDVCVCEKEDAAAVAGLSSREKHFTRIRLTLHTRDLQ